MRQVYIIIISILLCHACKTKQAQDSRYGGGQIDIDITNTAFVSDKPTFDIAQAVQLETTAQSVLGQINKVIPFDNKLFVLSFGYNVMVFENTGKFIRSIPKGRGPDEIVYPTDIAINEKQKQLTVLDRYRVIKTFDFEGNGLSTHTLNMQAMYVESIGDRLILFDSNLNTKDDYYTKIISGQKETKEFFPKPVSKLRNTYNMVYPYVFTKSNQDTVLVSCLFSDTIYCVCDNGQNIRPLYVMDYHGKSANLPERIKSISNVSEYMDMYKSQNYVSGVRNLAKLNNKLYFLIGCKESFHVEYDLQTNTASLHTRLFEGLPDIFTTVGSINEYVIFSMSIPFLKKYFENTPISDSAPQILKNIKETCTNEENNPMILFCKFRS